MSLEERLKGYTWQLTNRIDVNNCLYNLKDFLEINDVVDNNIILYKTYLFIYGVTGGYNGGNYLGYAKEFSTGYKLPDLKDIFSDLETTQLNKLEESPIYYFSQKLEYGNVGNYVVRVVAFEDIVQAYKECFTKSFPIVNTLQYRLKHYNHLITSKITYCDPLHSLVINWQDKVLEKNNQLNNYSFDSQLAQYTNIYLDKEYLFIYGITGGYSGGNHLERASKYTTNFSLPQLHEVFLELTGFEIHNLEIEKYEFTDQSSYGNCSDYIAFVIEMNKIASAYDKYKIHEIPL